MATAKKLGFKIGDLVHTGYFPGILIGDLNTSTPMCEVWGIEVEMGSAYASEMGKMDPKEWLELVRGQGHKLPLRPFSPRSKAALKAAGISFVQ